MKCTPVSLSIWDTLIRPQHLFEVPIGPGARALARGPPCRWLGSAHRGSCPGAGPGAAPLSGPRPAPSPAAPTTPGKPPL